MPIKEKKVLTPEEKFKIELQTETELLRLQRQYHILERDRSTFGASSSLAKQKKVINILRREYNEIVTDLSVAGSETNEKQDDKVAENLRNLLAVHDKYLSDIKRERAFLAEINMQISMAKKAIIELRSRSLTELQASERIFEGQRTLEALENKLEMATKRFCMTLTGNRELRGEIDHLLKERAHFNKLWDKLVMNLSQGKKFMLDLIEQATIAYDQREEWCHKLHTLRIRAHNEFMAHTQEMTQMQRQIDHETKLQNFLTIKGQKRIMKMLFLKENEKREEQTRDMEDRLEKYGLMLTNIKSYMDEPNLHIVAEKFVEVEAHNFSMFQYINDINKELEKTSHELMHYHLFIDEQQRLRAQRDLQQQTNLKKLEEELDLTKGKALYAETQMKQTERQLGEVIEGIDKLFAMCKCSNAPLLELLGNNSKINFDNILLYIEILERNIYELIITTRYKEVKDKKARQKTIKEDKIRHHTLAVDEMVDKDPCPLCVEQTMVSDLIDVLQKVMNKEDIKEKLVEAIEKRGFSEVIHNVSGCHLPKSRALIQRRYQ